MWDKKPSTAGAGKGERRHSIKKAGQDRERNLRRGKAGDRGYSMEREEQKENSTLHGLVR